MRRTEHRLFKKIIELNTFAVDRHINRTFQRLVYTMLAPRLRQCFEFNIRRLPAEQLKMLLNRLHLGNIQKQILCLAKFHQPIIIQPAYGPAIYFQFIRLKMRTRRLGPIANNNLLNAIVRQNPSGNGLNFTIAHRTEQNIFTGRSDMLDTDSHVRNRRGNRFRYRVGYSAFKMNLN